jgi:FkbM family methyltransferase
MNWEYHALQSPSARHPRASNDWTMIMMTDAVTAIAELLAALPTIHGAHAPSGPLAKFLERATRPLIHELFSDTEPRPVPFGPFGDLLFPLFQMGNIDSRNLFNFDELVLFSFYWVNRQKYHRVVDIGANLGLHSILLDRCGYDVMSYEPDPHHFTEFNERLRFNGCQRTTPVMSAVSNYRGKADFVRVLDNTTSSHLAGAKQNPYGRLETVSVDVCDAAEFVSDADLIKIDAEGHEPTILSAIPAEAWQSLDAVVEISTPANANAVFNHFNNKGVSLFAQKINWEKVQTMAEMPNSYRDGSLFISRRSMSWSE